MPRSGQIIANQRVLALGFLWDRLYLRKLLYRQSRVDLLIVDDWAMAPLADGESREFLEICDERYQARPTLLTSQLLVSACHAQIGDPICTF